MTVLQQSSTRADVQAALDGLVLELGERTHTIHAYLTMPPSPQPLDAWTQWDRTDWVNPYAHRTTWNVLVILPQRMPADVDLDDAVAAAVGGALAQRIGGVVGPAQPVGVRLQAPTAPTVPAVSITYVV